jgi:hypothetical protein
MIVKFIFTEEYLGHLINIVVIKTLTLLILQKKMINY